jgi:glyoxylase-like metal-dependent hydrolase (beta-lactamase superfamily II)
MALGALIVIGALSLAVTAQQPGQGGRGQQAPRTVEVDKLKDNLFVLRGGGGNTGVFVMANGVAVIDTKNPGWGAPILAKIKELTPKPVTMIINTHTHGDHVSGNVEFPATVDIIAQENTAANMKRMAPVTGLQAPLKPGETPPPTIFEQNQGRGLPKRTFGDRMTIGAGADRMDLFYFGPGHTGGDAWVLFPTLRVVHAGDMFAWSDQIPIVDKNNGGSAVGMPATQMKAYDALRKQADTIITGHSGQKTFDDLRAIAEFNRGFVEAMRAAKKAGKTPEQAAKEWTAPAGFQAPAANRLLANVTTAFEEIK